MAISTVAFAEIKNNIQHSLDEEQLTELSDMIDNRLVELSRRDNKEDEIFNKIDEYVSEHGDLEICIFAHGPEGQRVVITPYNISHLFVKHATNT